MADSASMAKDIMGGSTPSAADIAHALDGEDVRDLVGERLLAPQALAQDLEDNEVNSRLQNLAEP